MKTEPTKTPGALASCDRCGRQLRVAAARLLDSAPVRLAKVPEGLCADCVMTAFLYNTYPINWQLDEAGPELLLKPHILEAFEMSGVFEKCDLNLAEINWQCLVANWNLPVEINKKDPRNPYRMGESPRSKARKAKGIQ